MDEADSARHYQAALNALAEQQHAARRAIEQSIAAANLGICRVCANPIEPERLRALPFAVRCAGCQAAHEKQGPRHAR